MNDIHTAAAYQAMDRSVGYDPADCAPAPEKALMATRERVGMLIERVMEVASRLEVIGGRAFGSVPTGKQESCADPVRYGDMGAINDGLDTLGAQIARAHDAMTRLESL